MSGPCDAQYSHIRCVFGDFALSERTHRLRSQTGEPIRRETGRPTRARSIYSRPRAAFHSLFTTRTHDPPKLSQAFHKMSVQIAHALLIRTCVFPSSCPVHHTGMCRALHMRRVGGSVAARRAGLEPDFRKEGGGSGQEPRAGRQPDSRQANPRNGETPGTSCGGFIAAKVMGGAGVKASARCAGGRPGEEKPKRGAVRSGPKQSRPTLHSLRGARP